MVGKIKNLVTGHRTIVANMSYMSLLQLFILVAPLITYPYLVRVLGRELYGVVLSAQMLASYMSVIIIFGTDSVCAKHVSFHRDYKDKLSEIVSSVLCIRLLFWIICFFIYCLVVFLVPSYREYYLLFLISYGLTTYDLLFPQFFFQGIEQMKYTTFISIGIRTFFLILVFIIVKSPEDVLLVPVLYGVGYLLGGVASLLIIKNLGVQLKLPKKESILFYIKDCLAIFATDVICTIKDKLNYLLVGTFSGMGNVVVYDLGSKINGLLSKPTDIIRVVIFPRLAKSKDLKKLKQSIYITTGCSVLLVFLVNLFLPYIVEFFIHEQIDLLPIRVFTLAPIILSISVMLAYNLFIAFGYNKYVLYSIIVTTIAYLITLVVFYFSKQLSSIYSFVLISLISYFVELLYRLFACRKVVEAEHKALINNN